MILWLKALHLIFAFAWMAGLLYLPRLFAYHAACDDAPGQARFRLMESRLLRRIMGPAMLGTLVFGFWRIGLGGLPQPLTWLWIKLALVAVLVAFHIWCGRCVRAFANGNIPHSEKFFRVANEVPALLLVGIVILAVVKPV